jgi:hypothetical protein
VVSNMESGCNADTLSLFNVEDRCIITCYDSHCGVL